MYHPLSDGQELFIQGEEYLIQNGKDLNRLLSRGDFICLDPDPVEEAVNLDAATEPEEGSFLARTKKNHKKEDKEEVTN